MVKRIREIFILRYTLLVNRYLPAGRQVRNN
jgi:hypothetical protein